MVTQAELDAAYKAARAAIAQHSPMYSGMISDELLQSIIAPAYRAGVALRTTPQAPQVPQPAPKSSWLGSYFE